MTATATHPDSSITNSLAPSRWFQQGAAITRIAFGAVWAIDATFKWLPGFIHGQTLTDELGKASEIQIPVIHQWLVLWNTVGTASPGAFAVVIAIIESLFAVAILCGAFSNVAFLGSALLSLGIWSGAEGLHLPWGSPGQTDLGPSVGYIFASLGLYFAVAGSTWSVDSWLRPRLGRFARLASRTPVPTLGRREAAV